MSFQKKEEVSSQTSEVCKFYEGKSLFITGAGGFLGVVLLETLLRCCPDIHRIYILLRPKKGVQPEERKEIIFKKDIFYKLKEKNPDALKKVIVVPGDVSSENLGMFEEDMRRVTEDVSIVFHCAAVVSFLKSLNFTLQQNVVGTYNIVQLCRKLKKLEVLVYTSTAYSNSYQKCIEEKVYDLPFRTDEVIELAKNGSEMELKYLYDNCPKKFPNNYTFSKAVAEQYLSEKAFDLPVVIVRPSIILWTYKGVLPGYIEYGSGFITLSIGIGKGFVRVIRIDKDKIADGIPVDIVANTHIVSAYFQVADRLPSPTVYNCTSGELAPFKWGNLYEDLFGLAKTNPLPRCFQKPGVTVCTNPIKYWFLSVFHHYIPALVMDIILWISGAKLRLFKLYQLYDKGMAAMTFFSLNEWEFRCENFKSLLEKLNPTDSEFFPVDVRGFRLKKSVKDIINNAPMYRAKDDKPEKDRKRIIYLRYCFTLVIKWSVLAGIASVFYMAIF